MISYRFEETIERPPEAVWAYATDIARHPEWMGVLDAAVVAGDPTQPGAIGRESIRVGPRTYAMRLTVAAAKPGRLIAWTIDGGPMAGEARLELESAGSGTRVAWSGDVQMKGLWRLLEPLVGAEMRSGEQAELGRLKARLEADGVAAAGAAAG